jgi:hypothetical protein
MKARWIIAGLLGLAGLAGLYMTVVTWSVPDGGSGVFAAFTAVFFVLAYAFARPEKKKEEAANTRFVPAWFMDGAILIFGILILIVIASCIFGGKP